MERSCVRPECDGTVMFGTGSGRAAGGQPLRHSATCHTCGTAQYLTDGGWQGLQAD